MSPAPMFTGHSDVNLGDPNGPAVVLKGYLAFTGTSTVTVVPVLVTFGIVHFTGTGSLSVRPNDPYFV